MRFCSDHRRVKAWKVAGEIKKQVGTYLPFRFFRFSTKQNPSIPYGSIFISSSVVSLILKNSLKIRKAAHTNLPFTIPLCTQFTYLNPLFFGNKLTRGG